MELITKVCFSSGWKNESGKEQSVHHGYLCTALGLVWREWLLLVFTNDATEEQRTYLGYYLKYSFKMLIEVFFTRMEQLNLYLSLMSCLKDSRQATKLTAGINVFFPEHKLAVIILHCMPQSYDDHYYLTTNFIQTALASFACKAGSHWPSWIGYRTEKMQGRSLYVWQKWKEEKFQPNNNKLQRKKSDTCKNKEF